MRLSAAFAIRDADEYMIHKFARAFQMQIRYHHFMSVRKIPVLPVATACVVLLAACGGEAEGDRLSPRERVSATLGAASVLIEYGRPYKKGREIYGGLVPFGEVWRTGADEATTLETDRDLMLGSLHVPAGKYSLFTIPEESKWTLVVNKVSDQWGAFSYDEGEDLGQVEMNLSQSNEVVEQLTIRVESVAGSNGTLAIDWDTTSATLAVMAH